MSDRIRLLEIINSTVDKHGSFEDFFLQLAHSARERDWNLAFLFPRVATPAVREAIEATGATVHTMDGAWASWRGALELIRTIARLRPQIVNCHFCGSIHYLLVFAFCRITGRKVIFHYHGEIRPLETLRWRNRHLSAMRLTSLFWTRAVTVSEANRRYLEALHTAAPITVIYNGIDTERYRNDLRAGSGGGENARLCYIGSLIPRKRVDILLNAFAHVVRERPGVRLTIIGGGYLAAAHQQLAKDLRLEDRVTFTGSLSEYPFELLRSSDLLVSASESESFGLIFCEAMCLGVPVVACKVGGIPEVVQHGVTGLLAPAGDARAFADAILQLIGDEQRRIRMAEAGPKWVRERFDLREKVDALLKLVESCR